MKQRNKIFNDMLLKNEISLKRTISPTFEETE